MYFVQPINNALEPGFIFGNLALEPVSSLAFAAMLLANGGLGALKHPPKQRSTNGHAVLSGKVIDRPFGESGGLATNFEIIALITFEDPARPAMI